MAKYFIANRAWELTLNKIYFIIKSTKNVTIILVIDEDKAILVSSIISKNQKFFWKKNNQSAINPMHIYNISGLIDNT